MDGYATESELLYIISELQLSIKCDRETETFYQGYATYSFPRREEWTETDHMQKSQEIHICASTVYFGDKP